MRFFIAAMAVLFFALYSNPAQPHDIYTNWAMPDQRNVDGKRLYGCCNNLDCAPRPSRMTGYGRDGKPMWEVQFEGRWIKVPDQKVETNYDDAWDPGDHRSHGCISKSGNVYCFRPGEWLQ